MTAKADDGKCGAAALKYVSYGMRTRGQVRDYLMRKGFEEEAVSAALDLVEEYGYINDADYCKSYYMEACRRGRGIKRIELELEKKKIPGDVIRQALGEMLSEDNPDYDDIIRETLTEKERAMALGLKMKRQQLADGKTVDEAFCGRVGRRLASMGYGSGVIYSVISGLKKESSDE